jgi:hypothetical protein
MTELNSATKLQTSIVWALRLEQVRHDAIAAANDDQPDGTAAVVARELAATMGHLARLIGGDS